MREKEKEQELDRVSEGKREGTKVGSSECMREKEKAQELDRVSEGKEKEQELD